MGLTSRISEAGDPAEDAEDFLSAALGTVFPDDVATLHGGDAGRDLLYASPHLPRPLRLTVADPDGEEQRGLFAHYLWNASLLLAELVEEGTLGRGGAVVSEDMDTGGLAHHRVGGRGGVPEIGVRSGSMSSLHFNVTGLSCIELGAGTALPSMLAGLLGAKHVAVTDYPSPSVIANLRRNIQRCVQPSFSPFGTAAPAVVEGHGWGDLSNPFAQSNHHAYDRVLACDCLWMTGQHGNLHRSIAWFLRPNAEARCWVVAGFHTGRAGMRGFFDTNALAAVGLGIEAIWERDCDGAERAWVEDRGAEDVGERKRWLVVAVLRRTATTVADPESAASGP